MEAIRRSAGEANMPEVAVTKFGRTADIPTMADPRMNSRRFMLLQDNAFRRRIFNRPCFPIIKLRFIAMNSLLNTR